MERLTRCGLVATIETLEGKNPTYPVKGYVTLLNGEKIRRAWTRQGKYLRDTVSPYDLV
jgi:hypothetical protein